MEVGDSSKGVKNKELNLVLAFVTNLITAQVPAVILKLEKFAGWEGRFTTADA
jgi:hypothetical protein